MALFGKNKKAAVNIEQLVLEICHRLHGDVSWTLDRDADAVVGDGRFINLSNLRAHYRTLEPHRQRAWVEMTIPPLLSTDKKSTLERSTLRAVIRNRSVLEGVRLHAMGQDQAPTAIPHVSLTEDLCAMLVIDGPTSMMVVNDEHLDEWGVSFGELWPIGLSNVRDLEPLTWQVIDDGVLAAHGDDYVSARLLLPELLNTVAQLPVSIDKPMVAIPALRTSLYLAPLDDAAAIESAMRAASAHLEDASQISFWPVVVDDEGSMRRLALDPTHGAYNSYRQLTRLDLEATYAGPSQQLQRLVGEDLTVAPVRIGVDHTGLVESYATWGDGETLIPNVDAIVFEGAGQPRQSASFADVWATCHDLFEPTDHYPARWRVNERPDRALVDRIARP